MARKQRSALNGLAGPFVAALMAAAVSQAAIASSDLSVSRSDDLISACVAEAHNGFALGWLREPSLRVAIEGQRARMAYLCEQWKTVQANNRERLLSDCLSQAARGPNNIQRRRNRDPEHITRQKDLCRELRNAAG